MTVMQCKKNHGFDPSSKLHDAILINHPHHVGPLTCGRAATPRFFVKEVKLTREMFLKNFVAAGGLMTGAVGVLSRIY